VAFCAPRTCAMARVTLTNRISGWDTAVACVRTTRSTAGTNPTVQRRDWRVRRGRRERHLCRVRVWHREGRRRAQLLGSRPRRRPVPVSRPSAGRETWLRAAGRRHPALLGAAGRRGLPHPHVHVGVGRGGGCLRNRNRPGPVLRRTGGGTPGRQFQAGQRRRRDRVRPPYRRHRSLLRICGSTTTGRHTSGRDVHRDHDRAETRLRSPTQRHRRVPGRRRPRPDNRPTEIQLRGGRVTTTSHEVKAAIDSPRGSERRPGQGGRAAHEDDSSAGFLPI
jgi:hypothetical protein